jgi:hypothetical protein
MNSFGFIREACHALGFACYDIGNDIFDDLVEYDTTQMSSSNKSKIDLTNIAGGDYWMKIIEDYQANKYDGYKAEELFAEQYCKRLMKYYKYVLNMPLRIREGQRPKYRMIHITNHEDGCILMVENIQNRWEKTLQILQANGQSSLFAVNIENQLIYAVDIKNRLSKHLLKYTIPTPINTALSEFYSENGVICSMAYIRELLKDFEKDNYIEINRNPEKTRTGERSMFLTPSRGKKVFIKIR